MRPPTLPRSLFACETVVSSSHLSVRPNGVARSVRGELPFDLNGSLWLEFSWFELKEKEHVRAISQAYPWVLSC
jgi:hypothetical protein